MTTPENGPSEKPAEDFTKSWRYKVGLGLFILGQVALVVGLLLPVLGLAPAGKAGIVGVLIIGGEVVSLSSIVFLGKEGFKALKNKILSPVKAGYVAPVGPVRHYIGIVLLLTNVVTTYTMAVYAWDAFGAATREDPTSVVWGLDIAQQASMVGWLFFIGEISFIIALYVLGADWWGRFRNVFVWQEPEG